MQQRQIDLTKMQDVKCPCGCATFTQIQFLKRIPALLVGAPADATANIPAYQCTNCKKVLDLGKAMQKAAQNDLIDNRKL